MPAAGVMGWRLSVSALFWRRRSVGFDCRALCCLRFVLQYSESKGELMCFDEGREIELLTDGGQRLRLHYERSPRLFDRPLYVGHLRPQKHLAQAGHR